MSYKFMAEKEQPPSLIKSLPDDVIIDILSRVPRSYYPTISLVSKSFRKLVASPDLHKRRSLLERTEQCLYVVLSNNDTYECRLYILHRKFTSNNRLVIVQSLPLLSPFSGSYVAVGSKIYGFNDLDSLRIDCRSHTVESVSNIPKSMLNNVSVIVDGKIYLIGDSLCDDKMSRKKWRKRVMVFDTETQMWEHLMTKPEMRLGRPEVVVMENKIYMSDYVNTFVYEPKENTWGLDQMLNSKNMKNACVIDDVMYYYDIVKNVLRAYDPKQRCWSMVTGLDELLLHTTRSLSFNMVSHDGKLALFFCKERKVWCAEITLERCQGGDIWGEVQWCDVVIDDGKYYIQKCLAVMV